MHEQVGTGLAGDDISTQVLKTHWQDQINLTKSLEGQVNSELSQRDALREVLVKTALERDLANIVQLPVAAKVFTLGMAPDPGQLEAAKSEAYRKAAESRLQYVEQALTDAQSKLQQATNALQQATKDYAASLQAKYSRVVAIDQLRLHIKQNIIYYMQAIWDHEVADQRFFRLYNKQVFCSEPEKGVSKITGVSPSRGGPSTASSAHNTSSVQVDLSAPVLTKEVDLIEIADLDNPLGYKGNYIIFPLKEHCYLTDYMMAEFVDQYLGVKDPDKNAEFDLDEFDRKWNLPDADHDALRNELIEYLSVARRASDEIIVPTGQLFIEALPGSHPLLEDFKLLHRVEDVRKVKAEVRHAELENLRLASRLVADPPQLQDPDIEKRIVVDKGVNVVVDSNP